MKLFRRLCLAVGCASFAALRAAPTRTELRALIARADLAYPAPVTRSEDGLPVGNGRMGSLVWTTPTAVKFQINRVDLPPISAASDSFTERTSDYLGGCGFVDLDLGAHRARVYFRLDVTLDGRHGLISVAFLISVRVAFRPSMPKRSLITRPRWSITRSASAIRWSPCE